MRRVLVTGAAGFLGSRLAETLAAESPALVSRRPGPGLVACDLADRAAARRLLRRLRPGVVFHLAGDTQSKEWAPLWKAHVETTLSLLEALPRPARLIVAGSSQEYGPRPGPLREDDPAEPEGAYGVTKLCQTLAALSASGEGLDVRVARIFNLIGPGMPAHLALGDWARQAARIEEGLQGPVLMTGDLTLRRDFVDVRDASRALIAVARRGRPGRVYNVCSGSPLPLSALAEALRRAVRAPLAIRTDPERLRGSETPVVAGSPRRIRTETGWRAGISAEDSARDLLEWARLSPATRDCAARMTSQSGASARPRG